MVVDKVGRTSGKNDTDRYELERSIQASRRGGQTKSTGSKPIAKNGLPVCVLPMKAPVPDEPNVRPRPDGPFKRHFHAATSGSRTNARPPASTAGCSTGRTPASRRRPTKGGGAALVLPPSRRHPVPAVRHAFYRGWGAGLLSAR